MSQIAIWNLALGHLGDSATVSAPTELSRQAELCRQFWPTALSVALESHPWNFATRRAALAPLTGVSVSSVATGDDGVTTVTVRYVAGRHTGTSSFRVESAGWIGVVVGAAAVLRDFTSVGHGIALALGMLVSTAFGPAGRWTPLRWAML